MKRLKLYLSAEHGVDSTQKVAADGWSFLPRTANSLPTGSGEAKAVLIGSKSIEYAWIGKYPSKAKMAVDSYTAFLMAQPKKRMNMNGFLIQVFILFLPWTNDSNF